jgi:hypothetical protein
MGKKSLQCCILEGLKEAKVKALNYSQLAAIHQGDLESPVAILPWLKDAIQKHTNVEPGT